MLNTLRLPKLQHFRRGVGVFIHYAFMRTTIDLPDVLFRKTKAFAAIKGCSLKDVIVRAVQRETESVAARKPNAKKTPFKTSHIRLKDGRKLGLDWIRLR
jgi:hypothetical protein